MFDIFLVNGKICEADKAIAEMADGNDFNNFPGHVQLPLDVSNILLVVNTNKTKKVSIFDDTLLGVGKDTYGTIAIKGNKHIDGIVYDSLRAVNEGWVRTLLFKKGGETKVHRIFYE